MNAIPQLTATDSAANLSTALGEAGCAVVHGMTSPDTRTALVSELGPALESARVASQVADADFYPGHTRRVTALVAKSPAFREFVTNPVLLGLCDAFLLPNCTHYQLHVSSALVIGPGAREQVLHREDDPYPFFTVPRPHLVLASMWAMTDFTRDNGATLIVPGSHHWEAGRTAEPGEVVSATMPAGAMLVWLGGTLHGAGANTSVDDWRHGVFVSYSLGWLRQEENQYVDVPLELASTLTPELRALVGYRMHDGLGFYEPPSQT